MGKKRTLTNNLMLPPLLVLLLFVAPPAFADFSGRVVGVSDGDTIKVLHNGRAEKIRLQAVHVRDGVWEDLTVHVTDRDGYGRTVADVILPDSRVLNRELGAAGLAWWYRQYSKDESLGKLEAEAKATRRGLWADRDPSRPGAGGSGRRAGVLKDRLTP